MTNAIVGTDRGQVLRQLYRVHETLRDAAKALEGLADVLPAAWSPVIALTASMKNYSRLLHRLASVTDEEWKRYVASREPPTG